MPELERKGFSEQPEHKQCRGRERPTLRKVNVLFALSKKVILHAVFV